METKKIKPTESFFKFLSNLSPNIDDKLHLNDKFSRLKLLLKAGDLAKNGFPLPLPGYRASSNEEFVLTSDNYKEVWATFHVLSLHAHYIKFYFHILNV